MLFRIEDSENEDGVHREYAILPQNLPVMPMFQLEPYISNEIRKEINGAKDRQLLSYSKSLGICLLKYNKYADNEIHLNCESVFDYLTYFECKAQKPGFEVYSLSYALMDLGIEKKKREVILTNFVIDVSDNELLNSYLLKYTGVGRKKLASPEKDKEVLMFQSPNDLVITQYSDSVYLLYALVIKYGMDVYIRDALIEYVYGLEEFRFAYCKPNEREAIIQIIDYLYRNQKLERYMSNVVIMDSFNNGDISGYYDPITQFHDIQNQWFEDSFALSDYNDNVVSVGIWNCYCDDRQGY